MIENNAFFIALFERGRPFRKFSLATVVLMADASSWAAPLLQFSRKVHTSNSLSGNVCSLCSSVYGHCSFDAEVATERKHENRTYEQKLEILKLYMKSVSYIVFRRLPFSEFGRLSRPRPSDKMVPPLPDLQEETWRRQSWRYRRRHRDDEKESRCWNDGEIEFTCHRFSIEPNYGKF